MSIATTIEQSKRLLEAGLKPETADMLYLSTNVWNREEKRRIPEPYIVLKEHPTGLSCDIPAWSMSALWSFVFENSGDKVYSFDTEMSPKELMECLVMTVCEILKETKR